MNKNREQGTGNGEQLTEEERHEAATEEAATVGCPSRGIPKLPGGFDGTEPAKPVSEEGRAKVEQCVVRQRQKLTQIADLALAAEAKSGNADVKLGSKYLENSKALCAIRRICKESAAEEICPDYEWLARIVTGEHFEPECLAKAIEAEASKRPIDYPTFYTPGWLCELAKKISGEAESLPLQKEHKFGLLRNGVQMIRYASGPTVNLIGKRDRGPHERQDGKTGKVIYRVMLSRESKAAEVVVDGVSKMTIVGSHNNLLEHAGVAMLNCIIAFNARRRRHENAKAKRKAAAAK